MAKFFDQSDIDLFKECFFFNAKRGYTTDERELALIMRSLSQSPTMEEVHHYFQKYVRGDGKIDFAVFLEVMHEHSSKEKSYSEILQGFKAHDTNNTGYVSTGDARRILMKLGGEGLSRREVDALLADGNATGGQLRYKEFVDTIVPDY